MERLSRRIFCGWICRGGKWEYLAGKNQTRMIQTYHFEVYHLALAVVALDTSSLTT